MRTTLKLALGTSTALALTLAATVPAYADVQPNAGDAVGVGSDTVQYVADFLDNGYNATGTAIPGYNSTPKIYKIFNFDATADAAGRAQYPANGRVTGASPFGAAVVLRAGGFPYFRAQGSGDGIGDLLNDNTAPYKINFVRSSRLPSPAEQTTAGDGTHNFGPTGNGLHVYQIATDGLDIAVNAKAANVSVSGDPITCAPTDGFTVTELVNIYNGTYTTFADIPNYGTRAPSPVGGCATEPIAALYPDASKSGTGKDFKADLVAAGLSGNFTTRAVQVEEHDPAAVSFPTTQAPVIPGTSTAYGSQDTIAPFSTGRYNLIQNAYFDHVQDIHHGAATTYKDTIALQQAGVGTIQAGAYHKARTLYIIVRENDVTAGQTGGSGPSSTPFLPGGTQNLVQTLFKGTGSWYGKSINSALYTAAGVVQAYSDLGNVHS